MKPTQEDYFAAKSGEKEMFEALSALPNDFSVVHSFHLNWLIRDKGLNENEIDFLVFNPHYGFLFIEAKNAKICKDESGNWWYPSDPDDPKSEPTRCKDPFNQAFGAAHNLFNFLRDKYPEYRKQIEHCKFLPIVWLPKYTKSELSKIDFGQNAPKEFILPKEALKDPEYLTARIKTMMSQITKVHITYNIEEITKGAHYDNVANPEEEQEIFDKIICPSLEVVTNISGDRNNAYIKLLEEQKVVLDYLCFQRSAAISGASGTGKTLVAVERARRLSIKGEKVLFLCFNADLHDYLEAHYHRVVSNHEDYRNVDFFTIAGLAFKFCKIHKLEDINYHDLDDKLNELMASGDFPYQHIIVDEGQDFGRSEIDDTSILETFNLYGSSSEKDTSFFIFYDKNQLVNSKIVPSFINSVDSKLTLYRNCRNTEQIAKTAYSLIEEKPVMFEGCVKGDAPTFVSFDSEEEFIQKLNSILTENKDYDKTNDKKIVTLSDSISKSMLGKYVNSNKEYTGAGFPVKVYTSATIKGLEADDVVIIDLNKDCFNLTKNEDGNVEFDKKFYVAGTRAKRNLFVFVSMDDKEIQEVCDLRFPDRKPNSNKVKQLAIAMFGSGKIR